LACHALIGHAKAAGKRRIFEHDGDYRAFEGLMAEVQARGAGLRMAISAGS
jgi:hypothetical protein